MKHTIFLLVLLIANKATLAKNSEPAMNDTTKKAVVQVHLTNHNLVPLKNEEVLLYSALPKKSYTLFTDKEGNASTKVDVGTKYTVQLKTIADTTAYTSINIPPLAENQDYGSPFVIKIQYDPAKQYTFHELGFDFGKATVKKESFKELDQLVEYLQHKTDINIEIDGHTDNVGNEEDNLKLSKQRADAVKNYLVKKGIIENRIKTQGFGSSKPIDDNATEAGRQKNRRTELKIM